MRYIESVKHLMESMFGTRVCDGVNVWYPSLGYHDYFPFIATHEDKTLELQSRFVNLEEKLSCKIGHLL